MKRAEILDATERILKESGFSLSERCTARPSCFDLAVRRREHLIFIKVPNNVGNISENDASELSSISRCFSAKPLFISKGTATKFLEDDTVYMRYNIWTITPKTLENIIFREMYPLVVAGPGGYYVNLNCRAIREKREFLGLSVGRLAEMGGTSRRTLYGYEKGMAKASVSAAYNLAGVLGVPVVQPLNLFRREQRDIGFFAASTQRIGRNRRLLRVLEKLALFNLRVIIVKKAPFDFIAKSSEEELSIIGGVASTKERNVNPRAEEILSVGEIAKAQTVFITDARPLEQTLRNKVPFICQKDLERIVCFEELVKRL